jgi:hypothetical protein
MLCFNFVGVATIYVTSIHVHNNTLVFLLTMLHQHFHFFFHIVSCCCEPYCILSCNSCCIVIFVFLLFSDFHGYFYFTSIFALQLLLHCHYSYIVIVSSSQLFSIASHRSFVFIPFVYRFASSFVL